MQTNNNLRSALKRLDELLYIGADGEVHGAPGKAQEIEHTVKAALAEPVRQCEIGTVQEQDDRFRDFCAKYIGGTCTGCKLQDCGLAECALAWAQMPYKEGGAE